MGDSARWNEAFSLWLESQASEHTRRAYASAWAGFEQFAGKEPWEVGSADISRWAGELRKAGRAEATISVRLAAISSFYDFVLTFREGDGGGLHNVNPAAAVRRPEIQPFGKVSGLDASQAKALLAAIPFRHVHRNHAGIYLRDYALILAYLLTGKRNSEVRELRWGQIRRGPAKVEVQWTVKGGESRWEVLPPPVWEAIRLYLECAGRAKLSGDDFVFVALEDPFGVGLGVGPLTDRYVRVLVSRYAKRAGLVNVTVHTLRHTSTMLMKEAGATAMELQAHLGHAHLNTTQIYLDQLESYENKHWTKVADLLGLASDNVTYRRSTNGNHSVTGYRNGNGVSRKGKEKV